MRHGLARGSRPPAADRAESTPARAATRPPILESTEGSPGRLDPSICTGYLLPRTMARRPTSRFSLRLALRAGTQFARVHTRGAPARDQRAPAIRERTVGS